jgi:hypothetical protein
MGSLSISLQATPGTNLAVDEQAANGPIWFLTRPIFLVHG